MEDTIRGRLGASLMDMVDTELLPLKNKISDLVVKLDSVVGSVNEIMNADFKKDISGTIANLNNTTGSLNRIIGSEEKDLKATLENINKFSKMLSENSGKIDSTFTNLDSIIDTLAAAEIYGSITNLKSSLEKLQFFLII